MRGLYALPLSVAGALIMGLLWMVGETGADESSAHLCEFAHRYFADIKPDCHAAEWIVSLAGWLCLLAITVFVIDLAWIISSLLGRRKRVQGEAAAAVTGTPPVRDLPSHDDLRTQAAQLAREMRTYANGVQAEMRRHYQQIAKPDGTMPDEADHKGNELSSKLAEHFDLDLRPKAVELRSRMLKRIGRSAEPGGGFHSFALDGQAAHPYMIHRAADLLEAIAQQLP